MKNWSVSEAKARLSELLGKVRRAPQVIENRGEEIAVVISIAEYERLRERDQEPVETPMQKWLAHVEVLKAGRDLSFDVPPRRVDDAHRQVDFGDDD